MTVIPIKVTENNNVFPLKSERVIRAISPTIDAERTDEGALLTIHDIGGTKEITLYDGQKGDPGDDYILTAADKAEIAQQAAEEVDVPVQDVQVNGTSVVSGGVANVPLATPTVPGVVTSGTITITGSTPAITALPGIQYVCGECATLDITLPDSGCVDVVFESGSTPTVLTITPPTGVTVRWANGFDPTALDANTTYEINIADGLGVAAAWT